MTGKPGIDWPQAAEALAALIPRVRLERDVARWIDAARPRAKWGVAFSGGADSLALLLLLWAHWPERRRALRALHFDHRLRGAESRADAAFCRRVCRALKTPFVAAAWKRPRLAAAPSEAEARAARMAFFEKQARVIFFGHQQDDIAETMLMRLARGSGSGGLSAPRPVQAFTNLRVRLRPLLGLQKRELVAALRQSGASWCEDSTNPGDRYFRNRVRRNVLPAWIAAAQRDALAGAARSRQLLEEDDAALEMWLERVAPLGKSGTLDLTVLAGEPRALCRRALHRWLQAQPRAGEISRQAFDALLDAIQRGKPTRHSLGREGFAVTEGGQLRFESARNRRRIFHRRAN